MRAERRARLQIHLCVLLWGFTAILGKLITLSALDLVWWRMVTVVVALLSLPRVRRGLRAMPWRTALAYAGAGALVALHWLSFYASIKLADASVAATCIALAPVFLALVEPLVARRPFKPFELLLGVAVVPGVALVLGGVPSRMHVGVAVGALSALLVSLFGAMNKRLIGRADPLTVTCLELAAGTLLLTVIALARPHEGALFPLPGARDCALLLVLAIACTLVPFALSLVALERLSAYEVQLATNLEAVYAIAMGALLLGERRELGGSFYLGVLVVLGAVLAHPLLNRQRSLGDAAA
jgi:drug/metabolite transporter (DMT)-like permease